MADNKDGEKPQESPKGERDAVTGSGYRGGRERSDVVEKRGGYSGSEPSRTPTRPEGAGANVNPTAGTDGVPPVQAAEQPTASGSAQDGQASQASQDQGSGDQS